MASALDDAALDALAAALAPRLLREVRALLATDQADDRELGVAVLARLGYEPGHTSGQKRATEAYDRALGLEGLAELGYEPGRGPSPSWPEPEPRQSKRKRSRKS